MPARARKVARYWQRPKSRDKAILRTLTLLIPRSYNPNAEGVRKPVELSKLVCTFREIRQLSSGYDLLRPDGWYRDRNTGKGVRDRHFRFDIDMLVTPSVKKRLRAWRGILELRLEQQSIYMKLSSRVTWL
jgi:hypothetical protein